ncbi:hypothetical protein I4I73_14505 [Pseudonocardia sp. KRD-184]|uniref:Alkylmercury lyase-like protein n=1 Tax=Pseudonocardia oceani TaxID=2792013 RepID=A0ABS6U2T9_9PSEU|nr:organomercurial lyase [Pseudonocardia oceani]MBW0090068.1 hypothetical protein [Pseudonocardia oceani]MBW0097195.1 hypothetical protein [Pseudonocardia oceani]MBW0120896.1 hypothetical protein [Pseudonocardia oceani]MBW0126562.1 hypothetical protein [Pseudonocardia oceani]
MTTTPGRPLRIGSVRDLDQDGVAARQAGLPDAVRELHRWVLRAFLMTGRAPHRDDVPVGGAGRDEAFRALSDVDLVHLDRDGHVAVAYPFSGRPTGHMVQLDGGPVLHAMCAIDALGIPLMTGRDGVIVSADPGDGHPVRIERRGERWRWAPEGTAVLLAQTSSRGAAADCLCPTITFHTSRGHAEDHLRGRPELSGVVLDQVQALDDAARFFGPSLAPEGVSVTMLHTEGCPNAIEYLPWLRELVAGAGIAQPVRVRMITSPEQALGERFLGSPTVRVNGRDVDPSAGQRRDYGLSCRLYTCPDGLRGTPSDDWVLALLRPNQAGDPNR